MLKYENHNILKKYEKLILMESKKGMRRRAQILEDHIDNFVDELEKKIDKIDENPVFQNQMYQKLADMQKELSEFIMAIKIICSTLDSGAKILPKTKPVARENKVGDQETDMEQEMGQTNEQNKKQLK